MLLHKYNLLEKISQGQFGQVFKGQHIRTGELVAIKIELSNNEVKTLKNEAKIYNYLSLSNCAGFPHVKWYGSYNNVPFLVIDLLGTSLSKRIQHYRVFSLRTVLRLGIQIISRIKVLHDCSLLHRDIKPDNFLFGRDNNTNNLYLIDFGFCKRYEYNGQHIQEKHIRTIIGSSNFVSINVHRCMEPSRRDDIESCIYVILNMLVGRLEWFDETDVYKVIKMKNELTQQSDLPSFIRHMLQYVRQLKFDEKPNYQMLIDILVTLCNENGFRNEDAYEWSDK
jgi:serine/threonine protein kinase